VVGAYESAVLAGGATERDRDNSSSVKARFTRWEIAETGTAEPNVMDRPGPVTFQFSVDVARHIPRANHGIALFDSERRLIWGNGFRNISLEPGTHEFTHELSDFPLKPGAYSWRVTLWDEADLVDSWDAVPDLLVGTLPMTHWLDEWAGILNIPSRFTISQLQEKNS
jgi:hypothetical protein